jgi:hypothetical protein
VHRLFDAHLICVRYEGDRLMTVCSHLLSNSDYACYRQIKLPSDPEAHPDPRFVECRFKLFETQEMSRRQTRGV